MPLPRGKQSGINYGQKKQEGASDTAQLIDIANYLKTRYKIDAKREWYIIFNRETEKIERILQSVKKSDLGIHEKNQDGYEEYTETSFARNPDILWIDKYGLWVLELDGAVHDRLVAKTNKRNELYKYNHIKLIVVNIADLKELKLNIYDFIDQRIEKLVNCN